MTSHGHSEKWQFELFIIGDNQRSTLAIENFRAICTDYLQGDCHVDIYDIRKRPEMMSEKRIAVTPTLIKKYPLPEKIMVGDLSSTDKVLEGLEIRGLEPADCRRNVYRDGLRGQRQYLRSQHERRRRYR